MFREKEEEICMIKNLGVSVSKINVGFLAVLAAAAMVVAQNTVYVSVFFLFEQPEMPKSLLK